MSSKKEELADYESDEEEYSQSEEEDFMSCMSAEQKVGQSHYHITLFTKWIIP